MVFSFLRSLLSSSSAAQHAPLSSSEQLYQSCLEHSRQPDLYSRFDVSDSLDGRFDSLCLSLSLVMHRLASVNDSDLPLAKKVNQNMFDSFCADMDLSVREMGVGDLGVAKRVKKMSEALLGRLSSYSAALDDRRTDALAEALSRNLYRQDSLHEHSHELAAAVLDAADRLAKLSDELVLNGGLKIPAIILSQDS